MNPRCDFCGRFFTLQPGCSWQMHYSGALPEPDHESLRCLPCVEKRGAHTPDPRIKQEFSCGLVRAAAAIGAAPLPANQQDAKEDDQCQAK